MKHFFILVCILFTSFVYSQTTFDSTKVSPLIRKLANQIDSITKGNCFNEHICSYTNELKLLRERVKVFELIELVNHPSEYIRINTFNYLLDSAYPKFIDIIEEHLNDTTFVYLWEGHLSEPTNVIEGMLRLLTYNNNWIGKFEFTESDNKKLATLVERYWDKKNGWDEQRINIARKKFWDSLPQPNGNVNDHEKIFDLFEERRIDSLIRALKSNASIQITLITLAKINTPADSVEVLTQRIADAWKIGQTYDINGIVIGISRNHKKISLQMGNAIQKMISNQEKQAIESEFLKPGGYFKTTFDALRRLIIILEDRYK
jgi:hypothetical protein